MIRRKHSLCYKVFVASSEEDLSKLNELDDNEIPYFVKSESCCIYKSKKDVFNYLDVVVGKYPYISVMKETHKWVEVIFCIDNFNLLCNRIGYKREVIWYMVELFDNGVSLNNEFISFDDFRNMALAKLEFTIIQIANENGVKVLLNDSFLNSFKELSDEGIYKILLQLTNMEV